MIRLQIYDQSDEKSVMRRYLKCVRFLLVSDLRLRWNVPCGPNSVITFPGALWLKPWYWWSWPVLPLGIQWHEQRRQNMG